MERSARGAQCERCSLNGSSDPVQHGKSVPPQSSSSASKSPPKGIQFWILVVLSLGVSSLYVLEIALSRNIIKEQHFVVDQREIAESATIYKDGWQKLAVETWKASHEDPTLLDYLKSEGVGVHQGPPPTSEPANTNAAPEAPAPVPVSAPSDATKSPTPSQPATP
jgi:hypothetical protein